MNAILDRVFPDGDHPDVVIGGEMTPGLQALWNNDSHRYEVNPANVGDPGFAADVALMGRFTAKGYDRCGDRIKAVDLWNDYRNGVVEYLIDSDPELESSPASEWLRQARFSSWLHELEARDDVPTGGAPSLALVAASWPSTRRLPRDAVVAAVQELKPAPE